jgi:hypothetical protein
MRNHPQPPSPTEPYDLKREKNISFGVTFLPQNSCHLEYTQIKRWSAPAHKRSGLEPGQKKGTHGNADRDPGIVICGLQLSAVLQEGDVVDQRHGPLREKGARARLWRMTVGQAGGRLGGTS